MLTGKDETSIRVIEALNSGQKVKNIPSLFNISLDQSKRLSRYALLLALGKEYLSEEAYNNLLHLGLRALSIAELFKQQLREEERRYRENRDWRLF